MASSSNKKILLELLERPPADLRLPRPFVVLEALQSLFLELRQQIESDVRWLVVLRISSRYVMTERAERCLARQRTQSLASHHRSRQAARDKSGCDGFDIAFDSGNLAGEEDSRIGAKLQRRKQQ